MENVIRTRFKLIYESVVSCMNSAQSELKKLLDGTADINELELVGFKLKGANTRFVSEIQSYCKSMPELSAGVISHYTTIQIQAEDLVSEIQVKVRQNDRNRDTSSTSGGNVNITSKLPRMELGKFNGDILKWYQFWDQFSSNVHTRNISDVDKLLYLQSVLEGEAKLAIEGLDTTNKNYQIAVNTLKERYGKPAAIIDAHYVALYRIEPVTSNQIKDCRNVFNEIERHLRVLSSLGENVNHNHLRVMIMEKFPEDLIYEVRMKILDEDDSIDSIRKYLEHIISARETSHRLKKQTVSKQTSLDSTAKETKSDSFTLGSLHVKTEVSKSKSQRRFTPRKNEPNTKRFNKFILPDSRSRLPTRKRPYESSDRTNEPPRKLKGVKGRYCVFCKRDHFSDECTVFKTIKDRKSQMRNRCYICLAQGHLSRFCRSKRKCYYCTEFGVHNRALCPSKFSNAVKSVQTESLHIKSEVCSTLLQTCIVKVKNHSETEPTQVLCRILLDCGSQRSYITESTASLLNLTVAEKINLSIFTFGSKSPNQIESPVVNLEITTRTGVTRQIHANVVPHITHSIRAPVFCVPSTIMNSIEINKLTIADDGSCGDRVDILLGNDYYHSFMLHEKISVTRDLFLVNSDFGWIWSGKFNEIVDNVDQLSVLTYFQLNGGFDNKLNEPDLPLKIDDVKKFWDLESLGITDSPKSTRDEEAIKQFNESIQFKDNRYYVQWPWTEFPPDLPNNLGLAWGRLNSLLKRLSSNEIETYDQVIQEQIKSGIIEIVPDPNVPQAHTVHYLPHHCVYKKDKTKQLRIVYDASAKTNKESRSLNECLYRGPLMLEDLTGLLIKFREHPIGIVADVEKAFLQLGLQERDKDVTRFLWVKNINDETSTDNLVHLRFCRVPFGVISSPFLLNATIRFHLNGSNNILMKQIAEDIYVDNIVTGAQTTVDAFNLYKTTTQTFDRLSMNLHEWNSNSKELVSKIPSNSLARDQAQIKVLGLLWDTNKDQLYLKSNFENCEVASIQSKRDVLRVVASIYDPCGFAVPVLLPAKLFFQKLWKLHIKWDSKLDDDLLAEWQRITTKFAYLNEIRMDRYYARNCNRGGANNSIQYELHCFSDASMEAYAAVVYLRGSLGANNIVSFIIGKSRLVPLKDQKDLQIPRLELLGVLIGCRLLNYVMKFLRLKISSQVLWTDSQVVLNWLKSEKLLPPFVSRRINEIKCNKYLQVRYVPTKLNPSDVGTRSERVDSYYIWIKGPEFLSEDSAHWPRDYSSDNSSNEMQTQASLAGEGLSDMPSDKTSQSDVNRMDPILIDQHLVDTEIKRILEIQAEYFPKEMEGIQTNLTRLLQLYKDRSGILRCKGRLKFTDLTDDQKEPILLPKNSDFNLKVIAELHERNYHVGVSHTLALLRQKFWVPHGRATVQRVIKKCPKCVKYGGGPFKLPAMPDLPRERVKLSLPFAFTGLDYFGPLFVDEGTKEKRWVCLFTCLTIRAIHMEVVKDLSAEECLLAIRKFIAARGLPQSIVSDNAAQLKLTASVLASSYCIQNNVRWKFIPELAPWFGGFYERLIGLVKHCMKRTLDKHLINHSQLCTIIKELEAVLNTRPLTTVGAELEHVLSPADFLRVGGPITTQTSDREFLESATVTKSNLIEGWKRGQNILLEFSKMFTSQYLTSLRERSDKQRQPRVVVNRAPMIGETVQIKSDSSRAHWKVGVITELVKGSDGQIRVAKVKFPGGEIFTRSIGHLFPLEIDGEQCTVPPPENNNSIIRVNDDLREPLVDQPAPVDQKSHDPDDQEAELSPICVPATSGITEMPASSTAAASRPSRASAIRAREKVKQWTSQLLVRLYDS